ncbi:hypothetical protein HC891_12735 [Candidatus Gracilibacteria bacterium]|nr:hypothetical protein [Candidatus Gracilibacteria bacterium]
MRIRNIGPVDTSIETLYIVNSELMRQRYPTSTQAISDVIDSLNYLAFVSPGNGRIIDLSTDLNSLGSETVGSIYSGWLANQDNPLAANRVAKFIDNVIEAATRRTPSGPNPTFDVYNGSFVNDRPPFPNVKNIVLVGGDSLLPFFRIPDLTTIANERDYAAYLDAEVTPGLIVEDRPLGAALQIRHDPER